MRVTPLDETFFFEWQKLGSKASRRIRTDFEANLIGAATPSHPCVLFVCAASPSSLCLQSALWLQSKLLLLLAAACCLLLWMAAAAAVTGVSYCKQWTQCPIRIKTSSSCVPRYDPCANHPGAPLSATQCADCGATCAPPTTAILAIESHPIPPPGNRATTPSPSQNLTISPLFPSPPPA